MKKTFNVAVVGATGAVGETILSILEERKFPVDKCYPLASERSLGKTVTFKGQALDVINLAEFDFAGVDFALFSAGGSTSEQYAPVAAKAGAIVIDNTSHFRNDKDIPLVVPEVNPEDCAKYKKRRIIANPNCSTIQMVVALKPIYDAVGIKRINVATYQAVSGAGRKAISELAGQVGELLNGRPAEVDVFNEQIAFNVLPQIDTFQENDYTREEMKMVWETQKILHDKKITVNPTAVRVPVFYGHSEAINVETKQKISADEARKLLKDAPGVTVVDTPSKLKYPTPIAHGAGKDSVFVGRIREDISHKSALNLWVVSDNIRKGAALNAVQIAEIMVTDYL
jgi:aspartate-semialdehyde dehydrogenase